MMAVASLSPTEAATQRPGTELLGLDLRLPPTPPYTIDEKCGSSNTTPPRTRSNSNTGSDLGPEVRFALPPSTPPTEILELDKKTPDYHVPREPRLIRLTGVHPFNVEAPLSALYDEGFLTSPELFYVRNHGPVPEVHDATIPDFTVEGMVDNPTTITLKKTIARE